MKQLIISTYDYPYMINIKMFEDGKKVDIPHLVVKDIERIYNDEYFLTTEYPNVVKKVQELDVDQIIICEDGKVFCRNLK